MLEGEGTTVLERDLGVFGIAIWFIVELGDVVVTVYWSLSIQSPTTCAENQGEIQYENQRLVSDTNLTKTSAQNHLENHPWKFTLTSPIGQQLL